MFEAFITHMEATKRPTVSSVLPLVHAMLHVLDEGTRVRVTAYDVCDGKLVAQDKVMKVSW